MHLSLPHCCVVLSFALAASPAWAIRVDGVIDADEWRDARVIDDFRQVQPLTRAPAAADRATRAWVMHTPEGLAIAFRNLQPAHVRRTREWRARDEGAPLDRVNVYVDFDGEGRTGHDFTVRLSGSVMDQTLSNENQFNGDWDGIWQHAVTEDDAGWSVELLLPWHLAPMRGQGDTRTIGLLLDRVIATTGERIAWPAVTFTEPRFVSAFERIEMPAYRQPLLAATPYVTALADMVGNDTRFDAGADLSWKPNGAFQASATLNPDFSQVESDQLVVNFGATESFFSDRRAFFTEDQAFFDMPFGGTSANNRLLYTRRVGGPADDGQGDGDVAAAVRAYGGSGVLRYGVLVADENGEAGRTFHVARGAFDGTRHAVSAAFLRTTRPELDRQVDVAAIEHRWRPASGVDVRSVLVHSDARVADDAWQGIGAQVRIDHAMRDGWRQQGYLLHLGDTLELNDLGYLERRDFNFARYELARRTTPATGPRAAHDWRLAVSHRGNDAGDRLSNALTLSLQSDRRDGGTEFVEIIRHTPGRDDLILRGNGSVRMPERLFARAERFVQRKDRVSWLTQLRYAADGLEGWRGGGFRAVVEPTLQLGDRLQLTARADVEAQPHWLLWRGENRLGTFDMRTASLGAGFNWSIEPSQELRLRIEAIGLDADARQAYRVDEGRARATDEALDDFSLSQLRLQLRYRLELAPLSNLYIAYVRGGRALIDDDGRFNAGDAFERAFALRDSDQILVKLSYRFST